MANETTQDVHSQNCCVVHGCRFGNNDRCTVSKGSTKQLHRCGESAMCAELKSEDDSDYDDNPYESY